jgi:hypothetical protein
MNRRSILGFSAILVSILALHPCSAQSQPMTLEHRLVGTWTLVSFDSFDAAGIKVPNIEGSDPQGLLIITDNGRFSVQIIASYPKVASNDRLKTTPPEDRAVAHGALSYFGKYTVVEPVKLIYLIERSVFQNQVTGFSTDRIITVNGDELKIENARRTAGGRTSTVWQRIK